MATLYKTGRLYEPTAGANIVSWRKVERELHGGPRMKGTLAAAVSDHPRPTGGRGFIRYLIKRGWLVEA